MVFYKIKEILRYRIDQEKILKTGKLDLSNIQNASKDRMGQEFMEFEPEIAEMYWLEEIDLSNNRIAFLEFILNLKQLRILRLSDNSIVDFEGFERCKSLEVLEISETSCRDFLPLGGLTNLKRLSISNTDCRDISFVEHLINLEYLQLDKLSIDDFSALAHLPKLSFLSLNETGLYDTKLPEFPALTTLHFQYNNLPFLIEYSHLFPKLEKLDLSKIHIENLEALSVFPKLIHLTLDETPIEDLKPLTLWSNLEYLSLRKCTSIKNMEVLQYCKRLKYLDIYESNTENVDWLEQLPFLETINLERNLVEDLSALAKLHQLTTLNISIIEERTDTKPLNELRRIKRLKMQESHYNKDFIQNFTDLEHLKFETCYLQNLDFLKKLNQLKTVTLINCRLQNLDGLAGCYQLESLKLTDSGRELEDISTLFDLIENGKLRYIKINECFQVQEQIYQLEDGIALIDTGY